MSKSLQSLQSQWACMNFHLSLSTLIAFIAEIPENLGYFFLKLFIMIAGEIFFFRCV